MGYAILEITDGTNKIDLLDTENGYLLESWYPVIQIPKSGGTWNGSPVTDGRRLAMRHFDNAEEVFNLTLTKGSQDTIIYATQDLIRLLTKAVYYWTTSWQTEPVWIRAKSESESQTRYALIMDYRIAGLPNPYAQPFFKCPPLIDNMAVTIERDFWTEEEPGTATPIQVSAQQAYNGTTYGRGATTSDEVFIANKHVEANLTHAFHYDAAPAPGFSTNLINPAGGFPVNLFPAAPATGDILYIGVNTALSNSGPFSGVVFDLTTGASSFVSVTWYYRSTAGGGTWVAIPDVEDNFGATPFSSGMRYVFFSPPSDWTTTAVNGVTGYWIYGEITVGGGATPPAQGNRNMYAPVIPYVDIAAAQVIGDIPALSKIAQTYCLSYVTPFPGTDEDRDITSMVAVRSLSRGQNFRTFINLSDEQNVSGITITAGTDVAIATYPTAPSGRSYRWQATTAAEAARVTITFSNSMLQEYIGKYAVFLRLYVPDNGTTTIFLRTVVETSGDTGYLSRSVLWESGAQAISSATDYSFGIVNIPRITSSDFNIEIVGADAGSTNDIYFYDLVLIPADEWLAAYKAEWYGDEGIIREDYVLADSITSPKDFHTAMLYNPLDSIKAPMAVNSAGPSVLQPNASQRLFFYVHNSIGKTSVTHNHSSRVQVSRMARYMALRGNR